MFTNGFTSRFLISLFFLTLIAKSGAQPTLERELKATVKEVTIFLQGALETRTGSVEIPAGKTTLLMKDLSPYIDEKSIQVKSVGDFTVLSVNHKPDYLSSLKKDKAIDSLQAELKSVEYQISTFENRLFVLAEKQSVLSVNKAIGGENTSTSVAQIKQAIDFYDKETGLIKKEELDVRNRIQDLSDQRDRLSRELMDYQRKTELPTGQIEIRVEADAKCSGAFTVSYIVSNAGWYPKYDVRVKSVDQPMELVYKADVFQNTGVDWNNVKLKLSNGNPNQSGVAPKLSTWYLNFARNTSYIRKTNDYMDALSIPVGSVYGKVVDGETGESLPGVNVIIKGTTIGTVTDLDGDYSLTLPNGATYLNFSFVGYVSQDVPITAQNINVQLQLDIQSLEEVVVTGYAVQGRVPGVQVRGLSSIRQKEESKPLQTTTIENQTTVEFEIEKPYTVRSNSEKITVELNQFEVETNYEYHGVPKLDKDAFLIAQIIDWDQYNLLEGEANLYFEDSYVGRSILDARALVDTLDISLGRDHGIVLGREKMEEFSRRRTIGSNRVESRQYKILVRNKKDQPIRITLYDQIPVSSISDITVTPTELSGGTMNPTSGEVVWELELKPKQQVELLLGYEVKYPKHERVDLE